MTLPFVLGGDTGPERQELVAKFAQLDAAIAALEGTIVGEDRLFDVKAYGALGDGATDDAPAIRSAAAAAHAVGGGTVWLPEGIYRAGRDGANAWSIDVPGPNIRFQGEKGRTWIQHPPGMSATPCALLTVRGHENVVIQDLGFDGNWGNTVGGTDSQAGLNHATQADPKNYGLWLRSPVNLVVLDCLFKQIYGDAIWNGSGGDAGGYYIGTRNTQILRCVIDMTARDGISFPQKCEGLIIRGCKITNTYSSGIDTEPVEQPIRDVIIADNTVTGWWNKDNGRTGNSALTISGGKSDIPGHGNFARNYRVVDNTFHGGILCQSSEDVYIAGNRILCNWDNYSYAPLYAIRWNNNLRVVGNYFYDRTTNPGAGSERTHDATISVQNEANTQPCSALISGNLVYSRNGNHGIKVEGSGAGSIGTDGLRTGETNTATGTTLNSLTRTGAGWTVNQWSGWFVRIGAATAPISGNTSDTLQLWGESNGGAGDLQAWTDPIGESIAIPAAGVYTIFNYPGIVDVHDNYVDCTNDGYGAGGAGVFVSAYRAGMRVRVRNNSIRNATSQGLLVANYDGGGDPDRKFIRLDLTDNTVWDDQLTPTCTKVLEFTGTLQATKLIIRNNSGDDAMTPVTGLSTGWWLVKDGHATEWEGYGTPEGVVTARVGSRAYRLDGGASTTLYVKTSGTGNTGWTAK